MSIPPKERIAAAIAAQSGRIYDTPSGAMTELLTAFLREDDIDSFSNAIAMFAQSEPGNLRFLMERVPAKIINYLVERRGIDSRQLARLEASNGGWADALKSAADKPARLRAEIDRLIEDLR